MYWFKLFCYVILYIDFCCVYIDFGDYYGLGIIFDGLWSFGIVGLDDDRLGFDIWLYDLLKGIFF